LWLLIVPTNDAAPPRANWVLRGCFCKKALRQQPIKRVDRLCVCANAGRLENIVTNVVFPSKHRIITR
jgi:hypothetical protein